MNPGDQLKMRDFRIVAFVPGRRPTDEDARPGLGSSDNVALVTGEQRDNRAVVLFEASDLPPAASVEATVVIDDTPLPGWERRAIDLTSQPRQRLEIWPERDMADAELIRRQARLADLVEMETESRPQPCWNGSDATSSADITDPGDLDAPGTVSSVRATR